MGSGSFGDHLALVNHGFSGNILCTASILK
jgi:hypothetical protein